MGKEHVSGEFGELGKGLSEARVRTWRGLGEAWWQRGLHRKTGLHGGVEAWLV